MQGSRLRPIFWECASKNLTWSQLWECMVCAAPKHLLHTVRAAEPRHIEAGVRFHWSREEKRFQREHFLGKSLVYLRQHEREGCAPWTEHNGGFGFQTKMKDRFLNQRRWTHVGILVEKNMQVLSATASLVLIFFLFSFWKACHLCRLPHVTVLRLSFIFFIIIYLIPQCLLNILQFISR